MNFQRENAMASQIIFDFVTPSNDEGNAGEETTYSYELLRLGDRNLPVTVEWQVTGIGTSPATGDDFVDSVLPSGEVTFDVEQVGRKRFRGGVGTWPSDYAPGRGWREDTAKASCEGCVLASRLLTAPLAVTMTKHDERRGY